MNTLAQTLSVPVPVNGRIHLDIEAPQTWTGGAVCVVFLNTTTSSIAKKQKKIKHKTGFLKGQGHIPDDFDTMGQDEIIAMFEGENEITP
jgi:hypothetical protein